MLIVALLSFFLTADAIAQQIPSIKITQLQDYLNTSDSVLVINFWATFCKPCVEEMPYLQSISKKYSDKKVKLILVSLDMGTYEPAKIQSFAAEHNITAPIFWLNETNADYFCPKIDKTWGGSIPATYIINRSKKYSRLIEEQMKPAQFESELQKAL
ncbi:hypothetical protein BH09BAC2_BH09BAC2_09310 [soil metagenome]